MKHFAPPHVFVAWPAQAAPLNDTDSTWSGHATSGNAATCDPAHPAGHDCHYSQSAGTLSMICGSAHPANGFDYTQIANNGQPLSADTALGAGDNDWAGTRDVAGLI